MQNTTPSAGDSIEARCTKCRKNTGHLIVTTAEGVPANVQCTVCNRQHKYRPPIPKKPAVRAAIRDKEAERKAAESREWQILRPTMKIEKATDYSMTGAYKNKALINHPLFGLGLVQRVVGSQKVEVLFEDGKRMMRCK